MNFLGLKKKLRQEKSKTPENEKKVVNIAKVVENTSSSLPKIPKIGEISLSIDRNSSCLFHNNIQKLSYYCNVLSLTSHENSNAESDIKDLFNYFEYERKWTELRSGRSLQEYVLDSKSNTFGCPIIDQLVEICNNIELLSFNQTNIEDLNNEIPLINHVLVNRYGPDEGILHHEDGPAYYPTVAIISLNESCILSWKEKFKSHNDDNDVCQIFLESNSCVLFSHALYSSYLHGIEASHFQCVLPSSTSMNNIATTNNDCIKTNVCVNRDKCTVNKQNGCFERRGVRISLTLRHKYISL